MKIGKIEFEEEVVSSHLTSIEMTSQPDLVIKLGSFDPIILIPYESLTINQKNGGKHLLQNKDHNDAWTLVTRRRS